MHKRAKRRRSIISLRSGSGQNAIAVQMGLTEDLGGIEDLSTAQKVLIELCLRLDRAGYDRASRSSRFLERRQDATALCGTLAGAAGAAKGLGLDAKAVAKAIGLAGSFAAGPLRGNPSRG